MKLQKLLPLLIVSSLLAGCNLETTSTSSEKAALEAKADAAKPATTTTASSSTASKSSNNDDDNDKPAATASSGSGSGPSGGFVWKPISESNGKLAVILPPSYKGVTSIRISGARTESAPRSAIANGGRPHYRFSMPGAAYGKNITVSGGGQTWRVADGSKRVDL